MGRSLMTGFVSLFVLTASLLQDATDKDSKAAKPPDQSDRANKLGQQGQADQNQREELPESLTQLDLTPQQSTELLAIYRESDRKSQVLWDRVQDLHRQAISMEAAIIAAARLESPDHSDHGKSGQSVNSEQHSGKSGNRSDNEATNAKPQKANATEPGTKVSSEERTENQKRGDDQVSSNQARRSNESKNEDNSSDGAVNIIAVRVAVTQPDGRVREHLLMQPGQQADSESDPEFQKCQKQLTQVWKDIHEGHEQLVELEASTIVRVEAKLTEAQLQKLDESQSQASNTPQNQNKDSRR